MTEEKFKERIKNAVNDLHNIVDDLGKLPSVSLSQKCQNEIQLFDDIAKQLEEIIELIDAREYGKEILHNLVLTKVSSINPDIVKFQGTKLPFHLARLLGFQSYLSMTWAICDLIIDAIAPFVCTTNYKHKSNKPKLVKNFVSKQSNDSITSYYSSFFIRESYGLPIGISYAIRNCFVHDGTLVEGKDNFFRGLSITDGFLISKEGKQYIAKKLKEYNVDLNQIRNLPKSLDKDDKPFKLLDEYDDLLKLLELCKSELDDALGCLIGWSVGTAKLQVQFLLS